MSKKSEEQKTLRDMLAELIGMIWKIGKLQDEINDLYGVEMVTGIPKASELGADIHLSRGIEEVEEALGVESVIAPYANFLRELRYQDIRFVQHADEKTKVFVKAGKEPPKVVLAKVVLAEEDEE